jgi:uncharacterized membrane protein YgcG
MATRVLYGKEMVVRYRRTLFRLLLALLLTLLLSAPALALEAFEITAYDIQMEVRSDNSYKITESIDVSYFAQRHGIIRVIPLKTYRGGWASIDGVQVAGHKYSTARVDGDLEIKIGDANKYANTTEQYIISYIYTIGDDGLRHMDELYFNLIGPDWDCPIADVTFRIHMPFSFDASKLNFTYGKVGSTQSEGVGYTISGTTITGRLDGSLQPQEALTVALPLPQGYYADVKADPFSLFVRLGWLLSAFMTAVGVGIWTALGKKRQIFPTVEFYPPQGATSADVGYLIDGRVDPFDITSLIIYWADKGYLSITELKTTKMFSKRKTFLLTKLQDMGSESKPYEQKMFSDLFLQYGDGTQVNTAQLQDRFYVTTNAVKKIVKSGFQGSPETSIMAASNTICRWLLRIMALLAMVPAMGALFLRVSAVEGIESVGRALLFSALLVLFLGMFADLLASWRGLPKRGRVGVVFKQALPAFLLSGIAIYVAEINGLLLLMASSLAAAFILVWLSCRCERRTQLGDWYLERLMGFREFLKATEKDRIKMLVDENPNYFYHVLPYAMVLGVTDKWAKNFDSIAMTPPNWYQAGTPYSAFNAGVFARDLDQGFRGVSAVMTSHPSSQGGSSGGGSAGGGSGGGGGRSW